MQFQSPVMTSNFGLRGSKIMGLIQILVARFETDMAQKTRIQSDNRIIFKELIRNQMKKL